MTVQTQHNTILRSLTDLRRRVRGLEALPRSVRLIVTVIAEANSVIAGNTKRQWALSDDLNGSYLLDAQAYVNTVSSSGAVTVMLRRVRESAVDLDLLSTAITIDANEKTSYTAATPSVPLATAAAQLVTADMITVDIDGAGTGTMGLGVILTFGNP